MCALALLAWLPATSFAQTSERLIVKRVPGLSAAERVDLRADVGANLVEVLRLPQTEVVTVPTQGAENALAALNADPAVVYAEPDELTMGRPPPGTDARIGEVDVPLPLPVVGACRARALVARCEQIAVRLRFGEER